MKRLVLACLAASTLPFTSTAAAAVLYTFDGGAFASFSYVADNLITSDGATIVPGSQLQSCIGFFSAPCNSVTFGRLFSADPRAYRDLTVNLATSPPPFSLPPSSFGYLFSGDAFSTYGVHRTLAGIPGVLTVTAVPEAPTWAMLLLGFSMVGAVSRYRRKAVTVTFA